MRSGGADHLADFGGLVGTEIVQDDNVAGPKDRHELLLDIGQETLAVDWAVEDAGRRQAVAAQRSKAILDRIPAGRWGLPSDLAGTAVFLSSKASDYVNGAIIPVDGGWLAR